METVSKMKYSRTDRLVLGIGYAILGLFVLSIVVPLVYVVLASFMDPTVLNNQGLSFHIKDWTLDAYRRVLENGMIWRGFLNSFLYSLAFAAISVFVTLLAAASVKTTCFTVILSCDISDSLRTGQCRKHHIIGIVVNICNIPGKAETVTVIFTFCHIG